MGERQARPTVKRAALLVMVAALVASMAPSAGAATKSDNVLFWYQKIDENTNWSTMGTNVEAVVTNNQGSPTAEQQAVAEIHSQGAKAYRYFNAYWFPRGRSYQNIDIWNDGDIPGDWIHCSAGDVKTLGRVTSGTEWYFIDANERDAREALKSYIAEIKSWGYDGIFFDRGHAALMGGVDIDGNFIWHLESSCTADPVTPGDTLADAFVGLMGDAGATGLEVMMNYQAPFGDVGLAAMRSDPNDLDCVARLWLACATLDDAWPVIDVVLNEYISNAIDHSNWARTYKWGFDNENQPRPSPTEVVWLVKNNTGSPDARSQVYYNWARAALWDLGIATNTGDDFCGDASNTLSDCWRFGTYPELNDAVLGSARGTKPLDPINCDSGSTVNCVFARQYEGGMVVVNNSPNTKSTGSIPLGVGSCRYVKDLYAGSLSSACSTTISRTLPPFSGRVFLYPATTDPNDEIFFYRNDGIFRYYNIAPDGSIGKAILEGDGYTEDWSSITAIDLDGDGQDEIFFYRNDGIFRYYNIAPDGSIGKAILEGDGYTKNWSSITAINLD